MIFADDTQIYLSCLPSELDRGINLIAHDVGVIARYASENGLKLNLAKSKAIILGSRAFVSRIDISTLPRISVDGTALPFVSDGMFISPRLGDLLAGWLSSLVDYTSSV